MFKLTLTRDPDFLDEYGQPCYEVNQAKGLSEEQNNSLLERALADGYTAKVAELLKDWVTYEVNSTSNGRKIDLLEIGGGGGSFFECVKETVGTYINVDPGRMKLTEEEVERLADPRFVTIRCSAEEIPLESATVDAVLAIASLDHISDYRKALREISRLLRRDGKFILTLNNRRSWWKVLLSRTEYLKSREEQIAQEHHFQWSYSQCKTHLSEFFGIATASSITFFPFVPTVWRLCLPISDTVGKALMPAYGANILVTCQKRLS